MEGALAKVVRRKPLRQNWMALGVQSSSKAAKLLERCGLEPDVSSPETHTLQYPEPIWEMS